MIVFRLTFSYFCFYIEKPLFTGVGKTILQKLRKRMAKAKKTTCKS